MAQHHTVVVETIAIIKKLKGYPPINLEDLEDRNFGDFTIYNISELQLVSETEDMETFKAECSVARQITTSDDEYKVYKLIDWDYGALDRERGLDIDFDTKEKFEVIDGDCYWVDDDCYCVDDDYDEEIDE
jgi:hypothetical protein